MRGVLVAVPKPVVLRSEAYRRWVATQPCISCGIEGFSQCAHSNLAEHGKGKSMKACDSATFALCGPRPGHQGCHTLFDSGLDWEKEARAVHARRWVGMTQARAECEGWVFDTDGIRKP